MRQGLLLAVSAVLGFFRISPVVIVKTAGGLHQRMPRGRYHAQVRGTKSWDVGHTPSEAIGALLKSASEYFPIRVEVHGGKE